jgi:flagellar basal-body rod protein FlgC
MDAIANNIANAETTRTPQGGPYRRQQTVFSLPLQIAGGANKVNLMGPTPSVEEDDAPPKLVYDPGHPDADAKGYVALPNVNVVEEMVDMVSATRAYESNIAAITAAKTMAQAALEIRKG